MARAGYTEPDKVAETMAKTKKQEQPEKQAKQAKPTQPAAPVAEGQGASAKETPRLLKQYQDVVVKGLIEKFGYKNVMQVPKLVKITLNMGIGEGSRDVKLVETAEQELSLIAGQKARRTRARVSVSNFKLREGMPVGCSVTLRGHRMWEFLDRLINISIPRIRDFRGLSRDAFDGRGNHSFGIREHSIFMELDLNQVQSVRGMNINTTTTAKTDEEARELLRLLGMPFRA